MWAFPNRLPLCSCSNAMAVLSNTLLITNSGQVKVACTRLAVRRCLARCLWPRREWEAFDLKGSVWENKGIRVSGSVFYHKSWFPSGKTGLWTTSLSDGSTKGLGGSANVSALRRSFGSCVSHHSTFKEQHLKAVSFPYEPHLQRSLLPPWLLLVSASHSNRCLTVQLL